MENILQKFLFPPPPHSAFVAAMLIISFGAYGGFHEIIGKHLQYSKLFNEKKMYRSADKPKAKQPITVAGRVGMLIVYTPAFVFGSASFFLFTDGGLRFFLIRSALTLHFLKRILEVVLVHRYSGRMGLEAITVVPLGYFFGTAAVIYTQHLSRDFPEPPVDLKYAGILLFVLGITGNFYHHYILSNLRGKGEKEYKIPKGGLFNLVVLFVHKYSGRMGAEAIAVITLGYFLGAATAIYTQHLSRDLLEPSVDLKYAGILLFVLGITGNFYHHCVLSNLRGKGEKEYKIPKGGLFNLVICPHYLFEILVFVGLSFIAQTLYSICMAMGAALYLMGRSYATRKWYLSKFEDFPKDIKAIIPYVF